MDVNRHVTHEHLNGWLDWALANHDAPTQRARVLAIIAELIAAGGPAAANAYRVACDVYRRIDARRGGATAEDLAARWGAVPGEVLGERDAPEARP